MRAKHTHAGERVEVPHLRDEDERQDSRFDRGRAG